MRNVLAVLMPLASFVLLPTFAAAQSPNRKPETATVPLVASNTSTATKVSALGTNIGRKGAPLPLTSLHGEKKVVFVHFSPKDRIPTPGTREKIQALAPFFNAPFRDAGTIGDETEDELAKHGLDFELENNGAPKVWFMKGTQNAKSYRETAFAQTKTGRKIATEVRKAIPKFQRNFNGVVIVFADTYDYVSPPGGEWLGSFPIGYGENRCVIVPEYLLRDEYCAPTVDGIMEKLADESPSTHKPRRDFPRSEVSKGTMTAYAIGCVPTCIAESLGIRLSEEAFGMKSQRYLIKHNFLVDPFPNAPKVRFFISEIAQLKKTGYLR